MATQTPATSKPIILAVGGGIAAYKAAVLASRLVQGGFTVRPVMSQAAHEFIGAATLSALCNHPAASSMFEMGRYPLGPHIELAAGAKLMIVAPATADLLCKLAIGAADSLIAALYLQVDCPVLLAPAMSNLMWAKASVQRNVAQLKADGVHFIGPEEGWLSCRQGGAGRMAEPEAILTAAQERLSSG